LLGLLGSLGIAGSLLGCGAEPVAARAIWVDGFAADGVRQIQVYDRGRRYSLEVQGESDPQERARLGPRGRGLLVRAGSSGGVWFDLDDGRRMGLLLPPSTPGGDGSVNFAARGDALWWLDPIDRSLNLVPLAAGLSLARRDDGSMIPIVEPAPASVAWVVSSVDAPVLLVKHGSGSASLLRYEDTLEREATTDTLPLPSEPTQRRSCDSAVNCYSLVGLDPAGELAIIADGSGGWSIFDRRTPQLAGPLALPEPLISAVDSGGLRLLAVLDRSVSVWLGAGQLFRWDRSSGVVDSAPLFAAPPLFWALADHGHVLVLLSMTGPMYRIDAQTLTVQNLETTDCLQVLGSEPVVSPLGDWASWSCRDPAAEPSQASGVLVRASAEGLERFVGVAMSPLAIDDGGDLLVYSAESLSTDEVDGIAPTNRPRSLFVLSREAVLTRIDELEPAPAPVLLGARDIATFIQGVALD
jgi:hypothetical protein